MAASGALELIACLAMMDEGRLVGTHNLENPAPDCAPVRHARHGETGFFNAFLKNNFALGGVNSSVAVRRFQA
jgi:3-oxoacyl-[acyl-carrier-protein] synthase II